MKSNPFLTVWTQPTQTLRSIEEKRHDPLIWGLAAISGIGYLQLIFSASNAGDIAPLAIILIASIVFGPIFGVLNFAVMNYMVWRVGKWMGGVATLREIRIAIGLYLIPQLFVFLLNVPAIWSLGIEFFTKEKPILDLYPGIRSALQVTSFSNLILNVWSFMLLSQMLSEVQGFASRWKAFGNIVLAQVVLSVVLLLFSLSLKLVF